tara:strand:- start:61 stop:501 length:441 start_codon:yes stop_codon:yes gene_type:complete
MKIYNEVVYQIVDDNLVKVSEDSFEYTGEVALCGGSTGAALANIGRTTHKTLDSGVNTLTKGPGGTLKGMTDTAEDWGMKSSHALFGTNMNWADDQPDAAPPPTYEGGEDNTESELEAKRRAQLQERGRTAANQTQGQSASTLLTG